METNSNSNSAISRRSIGYLSRKVYQQRCPALARMHAMCSSSVLFGWSLWMKTRVPTRINCPSTAHAHVTIWLNSDTSQSCSCTRKLTNDCAHICLRYTVNRRNGSPTLDCDWITQHQRFHRCHEVTDRRYPSHKSNTTTSVSNPIIVGQSTAKQHAESIRNLFIVLI